MAKLADGLRVIDADSHMTERHDLFTERAPKGYEDRVPHVEHIDGMDMWVIEGKTFGKAGSGGTVDHDGKKHPFRASQGGSWTIDDVHPAAWDPAERLRLMDDLGIHAQVLYPNEIGIGGQNLRNSVQDEVLLRLCVELYNDAMAEVQERSGNRLLPMPIMPAWDIEACVREARRCAAQGARGVNMTADPQDSGSPDLGDRAWDPFWEVCAGLDLPVHFHIGASQTALAYFGTTFWPSQDHYVKPAIGGASLFQNNSRVLLNSAYSGMFDRHPDLKMVSVESGIGWVPFMLEAMDYELEENAPAHAKKLQKLPSEYFRDNWYATFWFETGRGDLQHLVDQVGEDKILFETDFPHPTCLHPNPVELVGETIATLRPETQRKVMGENAAKLYRI
ncbi:amidohydrolase [Frankia sp. CNm7]|uniref:Amidohydrolase n=1 Tax=Frankia nepalensis TaxID=1836974 RepID=A0A937RW70_9ACTN|nr:amidohydrolase family protein [Frankia nepalensis]MBL7499744.1 amidohydrolase [Frankia nepalensis]MBL7512229.1 amidohydrolase [Frankia nepalensis]MBL7523940.1 amidohydrolase [Frankia nepalensis]MBL7632966.1 amidohydrolase [Frankia nepalensis]